MRTHLAVVGVGALLLCGAPPAHAETAPAPCNGVAQISDPPGDSHHTNTDVQRVWFHRADDGAVTVNVELTELGPAVEHTENDRVLWRAIFTAGGARRYVQATVRRGETTAAYEYGTANGLNTTREGDTTGRLFTGKTGAVQVAVPAALAPDGAVLGGIVVVSGEANAAQVSWFDRAPGGDDPTDAKETTTGSDFRVGPCGGTPGTGGGTTGGGTTGGGSTGGGTTGAGTAAGAQISGVSLNRALFRGRYGRTVTLRGSVSPAIAGVSIEVIDEDAKTRAVLTTDSHGGFGFRVRMRRGAQLHVRAQGLTSASARLVIVPELKLASVAADGSGLRFAGTLFPLRSGTVSLEQQTAGQWIEVGTAAVRAGRFAKTIAGLEKGRFRAVLEADDTTVRSNPRRVR